MRTTVTALLVASLHAPAATAGVVIDMPAPRPKSIEPAETATTYTAWSGEETPTPPTVGDVALHRYDRARIGPAPIAPLLSGADFYATYGGYRVGISRTHFFAGRDWRGGVTYPWRSTFPVRPVGIRAH